MTVVIRMKRTGRRNRPCYRISVADKRWPRDGKTLETLGLYDPVSKDAEGQLTLDVERARHWLSVGALPSDTVRSLLKARGVYEGLPTERRKRSRNRRRSTAKAVTKTAAKKARAEAKSGRQAARLAAKQEAKKAAAAAEGAEA